MITHTQNYSLASSNSRGVNGSVGETGNSEQTVNRNFPAGSTNVEAAIVFTAAALQSLVMVATQNCVVKTNSSTSPGNTFNLVAGVPLVWSRSAGYFSNPVSADVTKIFVTCTPSTNLQIRALVS